MTTGTIEAARRYVRKIRNVRKQAYAAQLFAYLTGENSQPPSHRDISYMAAQAVDIELTKLIKGTQLRQRLEESQ